MLKLGKISHFIKSFTFCFFVFLFFCFGDEFISVEIGKDFPFHKEFDVLFFVLFCFLFGEIYQW